MNGGLSDGTVDSDGAGGRPTVPGRMSAWFRGASVLILAVALLASACGGGDSEAAADGDPAENAQATGNGDEDHDDDDAGDDDADEAADADETADDEADEAAGDEADETADDDEDDEEAEESVADEDGHDQDADEADDEEAKQDVASSWLRTAKRGDGGDHVLALQQRLNDLGLAAGQPDGDYGRRTERAVRGFQRLIRVEPTGRADRITLNYLEDYSYDGPIVNPESSTSEVEDLQKRLATGPFDPGAPDGEYGTSTTQAIWALEKLADIPVDGVWGPLDEWAWGQLEAGRIGNPVRENEQRWVEVDLSEQLMKVYDPGNPVPVLVSHASSGSGIAWSNEEFSGSSVTPRGDFKIQRRIRGWRESSLNIGRLYNPLYFVGGIAFHGATSVPLYPASHGCIRLPMHIADYLPDELPNGTPVHVMA